MHAVVVKVTINDREAAEKRLREETLPRVSQLPGVVAGYWTRSDGPDGLSMVVSSQRTLRGLRRIKCRRWFLSRSLSKVSRFAK